MNPQGGVTLFGLKHNIAVGILFIEAWLTGKVFWREIFGL